MKLKQLQEIINVTIERNKRNENLDVMIPARGRGGQGGTSAYDVKGALKGIDWDHKSFFIIPSEELTKLNQ